jgi:Outer membrane protein beta-barrel domain
MKRLALAALVALGTCASIPAQQASLLTFAPASQPPALSITNAVKFTLVPELAAPAMPFAALATPLPQPAFPKAPAPSQYSGSYDGYRWDLAIGYEFVHFDSAAFSANLSGLHTDLTYNVNNWVGLEGNVVSAFGGDVLSGEMSKYVLYTVGARINAGSSRRRLTPWVHALVGGAHLNPQLANESKNGFALQLGGGADWSYNPRVSFRAEADYVRTQLYSSSQNNVQVGIGAVIHF